MLEYIKNILTASIIVIAFCILFWIFSCIKQIDERMTRDIKVHFIEEQYDKK